jgi:protein gp37
MDHRYGRVKWGKGQPRVRTSEANWKLPLKWNRDAAVEEHSFRSNPLQARFEGSPWHRPRVFCASLADWLDDEVPIEWLADLLKLIHDTPNLDWLLLTKRPENWEYRVREAFSKCHTIFQDLDFACKWVDEGVPLPNIWLGTSVENQEYADKRIPELLKIPARVRFLSVEPLLGEVELSAWLNDCRCGECDYCQTVAEHPTENVIHQVIVGGESGPGKRPMDLAWARSLRDQCKAAGVKFFFKQIDKVQPIPADLMIREFPV